MDTLACHGPASDDLMPLETCLPSSWKLAHCVGMLTTGKTHQEKRQIHLSFHLLHPLSWTERIPHGRGCLLPPTTWECSDSAYLFIDGVGSWFPVTLWFPDSSRNQTLRTEHTRVQHSTWYLSKSQTSVPSQKLKWHLFIRQAKKVARVI